MTFDKIVIRILIQKWTSSAPDLLPHKEKRKEVLGMLSI